jgi:WD40 repeat protein
MKTLTTLRVALVALLIFSGSPALAAQSKCRPPPVSPLTSTLFNEEQEMELGEAVAAHIENSFRVIDDEEVTGYLRRIGSRLVAQIPSTKLRFQFFVVDINDMNAFTLPGGRIYVTRKLIAFAQNEDELAGVVAHELGHAVARHVASDMSALFAEVLGVAQVTDRQDIFEKYHLFIENRMRHPKAGEKLGSREDRNQYAADMIGLYLMSGAGYNPQAQAALWDRYHETRGKTGNFFSGLFGSIKPEQKRLGEMLRQLALLPAECKGAARSSNQAEFEKWRTSVIRYTGLGHRESAPGPAKKVKLDPSLRSNIFHARFSSDGKYLLTQDDAGVSVLTRKPLAFVFRIDTPNSFPAQFSPDSSEVILYTPKLRVERWSIADQSLSSASEVVMRGACLETRLSPDGNTLACIDDNASLSLMDVASGDVIFEKKSFAKLSFWEARDVLLTLLSPRTGLGSEGNVVHMSFSPDGRYFAAGHLSVDYASSSKKSLVFDLKEKNPVPIKDDLRDLLVGGFVFVGPAKVLSSYGDAKSGGLFSFPDGAVIEHFATRYGSSPATQANFVLSGGAPMDLAEKKIYKVTKEPMFDVFDDHGVLETTNGELELYGLKEGSPEVLAIPETPLGRLYAADFSPDLKTLVLSGRSRGAIWNVPDGKIVGYVRGFRGAGFGDDGLLQMDFPAVDQVPRTTVFFDAAKVQISHGPEVKARATQYGTVFVRTRPEEEMKNGKAVINWFNDPLYLEVFDASTMTLNWSQKFSQEFPSFVPDGWFRTVVLAWPANSKAALQEIKNDPKLSKYHVSKESESDYLFKVIDLKTGKLLGQFLVETNAGSFRITDVVATGDFLVAMDNQNRVLVYSLSTGKLLGRVFGNRATISAPARLLCVENESGQLSFYDLASFERFAQLTFADRVRMVRFSADGKRLAVLTSKQIVYTFDVAALPVK